MNEHVLDRLSAALAGRYALGGEIDRGGMAVVYLAEDLKHRRKVAIKVLNPSLSATLGTERFLREIEVLAKLQHPHVLTLIDSGAIEDVPYYVMPFVEGQSLKERLEREGRLPIQDAVVIACEVADALGAAHDRGVIHRDMKPGNVLLSGGHAVVADFGIAAAVDEAQVGRLTDTGVSLGSPVYMSPEQATGEREVDARADIYGLGCLLYEMLAGRPPFEGSVTPLLTKKVLGETVPLEDVRAEVPPGITAAVATAMQVDPDDRFGSAKAFREALLGALPRSEAAHWTRRRRLASVAAATLVVVVSAALVQRTRAAGEQALWASEQLTQVERLVEAGRYSDALAVAEEVEAVFPDDPRLAVLLPTFTFTVPIRTEPAGARVHVQDMLGPDDEWRDLGTTPIEGVRFAGLGVELDGTVTYRPERPHRFRFVLDGYQERELYLTALLGVAYRRVAALHPVAAARGLRARRYGPAPRVHLARHRVRRLLHGSLRGHQRRLRGVRRGRRILEPRALAARVRRGRRGADLRAGDGSLRGSDRTPGTGYVEPRQLSGRNRRAPGRRCELVRGRGLRALGGQGASDHGALESGPVVLPGEQPRRRPQQQPGNGRPATRGSKSGHDLPGRVRPRRERP